VPPLNTHTRQEHPYGCTYHARYLSSHCNWKGATRSRAVFLVLRVSTLSSRRASEGKSSSLAGVGNTAVGKQWGMTNPGVEELRNRASFNCFHAHRRRRRFWDAFKRVLIPKAGTIVVVCWSAVVRLKAFVVCVAAYSEVFKSTHSHGLCSPARCPCQSNDVITSPDQPPHIPRNQENTIKVMTAPATPRLQGHFASSPASQSSRT